ncbi:MAG: DoxX family protein [Gemmatimonadales bacterium]
MAIDDLAARWAPRLLSVLRMVAAFVLITHGTQKLFAFPVAEPRPPVELFSLFGAAGVLEVIGGPLLLLGLFTRPLAFLHAGEMAFAYFIAHAPRSVWPVLNGGEPPVLLSFLFLYLAAVGGGEWALDRTLARRRP